MVPLINGAGRTLRWFVEDVWRHLGDDPLLPVIVVGSSVMTLGVGMVVLLATDVILATAPPERAGAAAALSETSNEFGGARWGSRC